MKRKLSNFIEPEGLEKDLVHPNVFLSLPTSQNDFVKSIKGLENCKIEEFVAVEYDLLTPDH